MTSYVPQIPLPDSARAKILAVKCVFLKAQELTNVPWQAVAAIWFRESLSVTPPHTPGGPFQFDPPPNGVKMDALLKQFTKLTPTGRAYYAQKGVNDFEASAVLCACWLRMKTKNVITVDAPDSDIQDAMYGYNGRAYGSASNSPYVMNGYDRNHLNMRLVGSIPDAHAPGGRRQISTVDKRPGAFTVYKILKTS